MSMTALEWLPAGVNFLDALVSLATVEIELSAGEAAGRLLGQTLLELEAVRDAQQAVPSWPPPPRSRCGAVTSPTPDGAAGAAGHWSARPRTGCSPRTAAAAIEVEAATAVEARDQRDPAKLATARERAREVIRAAEAMVKRHGVDPLSARVVSPTGVRWRRPCASAPGRCADGAVGRRRRCLDRAPHPVRDGTGAVARGRGDARLRRPGRAAGRRAFPCSRRSSRVVARRAALLRELRELAGRALITMPEVDERLAGPDDRPRELVGVIGHGGAAAAGSSGDNVVLELMTRCASAAPFEAPAVTRSD